MSEAPLKVGDRVKILPGPNLMRGSRVGKIAAIDEHGNVTVLADDGARHGMPEDILVKMSAAAGELASGAAAREFAGTYYQEGDRLRLPRALKQTGWSKEMPAGSEGAVVGVDRGMMGTVAYRVRWDDGTETRLGNAHLVAQKI